MTQTIKNHTVKIQIGTLLAVGFFIWGVSNAVFSMKRDIEKVTTGYSHVGEWNREMVERQDALEKNNIQQQLVIVEVRTKLLNIEAMLEDIKQKI